MKGDVGGMGGFTAERVEGALQAFRDLLSGARREPLVSVYHQPTYRQQSDPALMVEEACACIRADAATDEAAILPTFWPDFGTISTARLWGGRENQAHDGGGVFIEPAATTYAALEQVIPRALPFEESDFQRAVGLWQAVCDRLESDEVFLRTPDFQGPMNTLAQVLDQAELMCGLYEAPELIGWALDQVTDVLIERITRLRHAVGAHRLVGNIWPYVVLPDGKGVSITQDYLPLLSAEMYAQFELPRLKRIAAAFGGVFIHCCGAYEHHLATLANAGMEIIGLEVHHPYTAIAKVYEAFGDKIVYTPYVAPPEVSQYAGLDDFIDHLATQTCGAARYWLATCHGWGDVARLKAAASRLGRL